MCYFKSEKWIWAICVRVNRVSDGWAVTLWNPATGNVAGDSHKDTVMAEEEAESPFASLMTVTFGP